VPTNYGSLEHITDLSPHTRRSTVQVPTQTMSNVKQIVAYHCCESVNISFGLGYYLDIVVVIMDPDPGCQLITDH
jgi:hypothetical protein